MAFTSIATTPGWSDNAVQKAYDLIFNWELKASAVCEPLVDVTPKQQAHSGSSVTLQLNNYFGEADIETATTPLSEEVDVTPTKLPGTRKVELTPAEYGLATVRTLKLKNRGLVDVDPVIAAAVAEHCKDTIDRLVQKKMRTSGNVTYAGTATTVATTGNTSLAKATNIRKMVTKLRAASVAGRDGQFYVGVFHPDVIHDLREESGSGGWRVPNEYGQSQSKIFNGEFGEFEGVRFISTPTVQFAADKTAGASSQPVYRGFILGREALAKAVVTAPQTVVSPQVDSLRRNAGIGWYADLDYGIYRSEALRVLVSGSSVNA